VCPDGIQDHRTLPQQQVTRPVQHKHALLLLGLVAEHGGDLQAGHSRLQISPQVLGFSGPIAGQRFTRTFQACQQGL